MVYKIQIRYKGNQRRWFVKFKYDPNYYWLHRVGGPAFETVGNWNEYYLRDHKFKTKYTYQNSLKRRSYPQWKRKYYYNSEYFHLYS